MSHDTTQAAGHQGNVIAHRGSDPMYVRAERLAAGIERGVIDAWLFLRFLVFLLYLVLGVLSFWLWMVSAAIGLVRLGLRALMVPLLWLSGGAAPRPGPPAPNVTVAIQRDLELLWQSRLVAYENFARPVARHWISARQASRTFWHWGMVRKATALAFAVLFGVVPAMFVIPRPHYVQITDDNAVHYENDGAKVSYLIHATDLRNRGKTREYENEDAWWLGKVNSQGIKSQLQPGKFYKMWVVGIRWYYMPRLFPNIIWVYEIDGSGNPVDDPSRLMTPPQATMSAPTR